MYRLYEEMHYNWQHLKAAVTLHTAYCLCVKQWVLWNIMHNNVLSSIVFIFGLREKNVDHWCLKVSLFVLTTWGRVTLQNKHI